MLTFYIPTTTTSSHLFRFHFRLRRQSLVGTTIFTIPDASSSLDRINSLKCLHRDANPSMTISASEKTAAAAIHDEIPTESKHQRRFAVLKTGNGTEYTERNYGGYGKMIVELFKDDCDGDSNVVQEEGEGKGEKWDVFSVLTGDFSFLDDYRLYDAFVITGSVADAHSQDDPWILRLCDALAFLHSQKKRLLGICFGHQILARSLGGATGRATSVGWEIGLKCIHLDTNAIHDLYGLKNLKSDLHVYESHRDQVSSLPQGAVILSSSSKTGIEMFAVGDHVLGMQCHPEFSKDVMMDIIQMRRSREILTVDVANEAIKSCEEREADQEAITKLCKIFLKGQFHG